MVLFYFCETKNYYMEDMFFYHRIWFAHPVHSFICIFVQMKLLAFILAIYIFALNLAPCEDNATCDNESNTEVLHSIGDDHQHQDADLCSPFCHCHCCHIHVTDFAIADYTIATVTISTEVFFYCNGLEKDFSSSILQPPQV